MISMIACVKFAISMSEQKLMIDQDNRICLFGNNEISTLNVQIRQRHLYLNKSVKYIVHDFNYFELLPDTKEFKTILKNYLHRPSQFTLTTIIGQEKIVQKINHNTENDQYISKVIFATTVLFIVCLIILTLIIGIWREKINTHNRRHNNIIE